MSTYYIDSANGNNSNDGLTPATAWASLTPIDSALSGGTIGLGDNVLFRRGQTHYGGLSNIPDDFDDSSGAQFLTFGAYGVGDRPSAFCKYKILNDAGSWTDEGSGVWSFDLDSGGGFTGNTGSTSANVGFIRVDDETNYGIRRWDVGDLADDWDFYCEEDSGDPDFRKLFVMSSGGNPASITDDVRVAVDGASHCIQLRNGIRLRGLLLEGSSGDGVHWGSASTAANHTRVFGCLVRDVGGGRIGAPSSTTRAGNGMTMYQQAEDFIVKHNIVQDTFDAGISPQGDPGQFTDGDIGFNILYRCRQGFEHSYFGASYATDMFDNVRFHDNVLLYSGHSWSGPDPDKNPLTRVDFNSFGLADDTGLTIEDNVCFGAYAAHIYRNVTYPPTCTRRGNTVAMAAGTVMRNTANGSTLDAGTETDTIEDGATWASAASDVDTSVPAAYSTVPASAPSTNGDGLVQLAAQVAIELGRIDIVQRALTDIAGYDDTRGKSVQTFTASGTWVKPPGATDLTILAIGPGGGGGSGRRGAAGSVRCGGGGGGGGARCIVRLPASSVSSTVAVTVSSTGGTGGAARTSDDTDGAAGNPATHTTFGSYVRAPSGSGGAGGTATAGNGGPGGTGTMNSGSGGNASGSGGTGGNALGASGCGGGGAGGGITSGDSASAGGQGAGSASTDNATAAGGVVDSTSPTAGNNQTAGVPLPGGGGGGGAASITTTAQTGAAGGRYGSGGGGGGASLNGNNSGAGGAGAPGIVVVIAE